MLPISHQIPNVWDFRAEQKRRYADADERAQRLTAEAGREFVPDRDDSDEERKKKKQPKKEEAEDDEEETKNIPRGDAAPSSGKEEKDEMMKKANAGKPTNKIEYKGERVVKDPVTGKDVIVKDADFGSEWMEGYTQMAVGNPTLCLCRVRPSETGGGDRLFLGGTDAG